MADIINHLENIETGESELWVTIKDASDLLGISERHTWNIILENDLQKKKLLNKSRKKTYVLRSDIEKFHKEEQERQRLEALKSSPFSEMSEISEKNGESEMSESGKPSLSERDFKVKSLPALLSDMQNRQGILLQDVTKWKVTAIWISVLGIVTAGFLCLYLKDAKKTISEREKALSESQKALSEMSEREKQAIKATSEREIYIKELEQNIPQGELDRLKKGRGEDGH